MVPRMEGLELEPDGSAGAVSGIQMSGIRISSNIGSKSKTVCTNVIGTDVKICNENLTICQTKDTGIGVEIDVDLRTESLSRTDNTP